MSLQLSFFGSDVPPLPEAGVNQHGVMVGNLLRRRYEVKRLVYLELRVGQVGGRYGYSSDRRLPLSGCCGPVRVRDAIYESASEAMAAAMAEERQALQRIATGEHEWPSDSEAARKLLTALDGDRFTENMDAE